MLIADRPNCTVARLAPLIMPVKRLDCNDSVGPEMLDMWTGCLLCLIVYSFQANLLKTMLQIETTFHDLAVSSSRKCLIICDRGAMDATAC